MDKHAARLSELWIEVTKKPELIPAVVRVSRLLLKMSEVELSTGVRLNFGNGTLKSVRPVAGKTQRELEKLLAKV